MATPPTAIAGALTVNATTGVILSPVTAALFKSANGIGSGSGDVTASGALTATRLILGNGTTSVIASDLSYSSPTLTVPASFGITGAGSLAFTAGGSNQTVTIAPSDAGAQGAVTSRAVPGSAAILATGGFQVVKEAVSGSILPSFEIIGYQNGQTAQMFNIIAKAGGTAAVPSNASAGATIGGYRWYAYANGAFRSVANISAQTGASFGNTDFRTQMVIGPSTDGAPYNAISLIGGISGTGLGYGLAFGGANASTTSATTQFTFDTGFNFNRASAWGTTGANSAWIGRTITDTVSSGTVAAAVANSFAVPTFAASSATTFTNAANLYIAGDVANGTNVTLTNSYGLWNVGKTRLDGAVQSSGNFTINPAQSSTKSFFVTTTDPNFNTAATLRAEASGTADFPAIKSEYYENTFTTGGPFIGLFRAGGTVASPSNSVANTGALSVVPYAYANSAFRRIGGMVFTTGVAFSNSSYESRWILETTVTGATARSTALLVDEAGGLTVNRNLIVGLSTGTSSILGAAGNMTITAGTGASRTLTLQGTTSGSTATTFLTGSDTAIAMPSTLTSGLQLYNTADQTTNYERLSLSYISNAVWINSVGAGSATGRTLNLAATNAANFTSSFSVNSNNTGAGTKFTFGQSGGSHTQTTGQVNYVGITPTYNQASGNAANTDLLINRTQTAVGSGAQLLIDAQVSTVSKWKVSNTGTVTQIGPLIATPSALTYASPTSVDVTLASVYTVTTVNATGSVTFNATAGGTAGQEMTILITNDATSAKTITFGTNFKTTGTLTASAASRQTTISFRSDGTNFLETGRAVLTT